MPTLTLVAGPNAAEPATNGSFSIAFSTAAADAIAVSLTIGGTATNGSDYTAISTSQKVPAGTLSLPVAITVMDDFIYEGTETIVPTLGASSFYTIGAPSSVSMSIADNDAPPDTWPGTAISGSSLTLTANNAADTGQAGEPWASGTPFGEPVATVYQINTDWWDEMIFRVDGLMIKLMHLLLQAAQECRRRPSIT